MTAQTDLLGTLVQRLLTHQVSRRRFLRQAAALGLSTGTAGMLLAACERGPAEVEREPGGALRVQLRHDILNLDPAFRPGDVDELVMENIYEGLISYQPGAWDVVHTLAEEFESSEDGLQHTFKLKEGIPFHGGYGEVTAEDVKFSYERIAGLTDPPLESPYVGDWGPLSEVQVTGKYTGTIILKEPFAALMASTLPLQAGYVLSKAAVEDKGDDYATDPVGTGPYEMVEWVPNQRVALTKFDDYGGANSGYADPVPWDELELRVIDSESAAEIALETGDIDIGYISPASVGRFEGLDQVAIHERTALDYYWLGMNVEHPKLQDINVRQAIRYAVDVPSILEAAYDGRWARATSLIAPGSPIGYWEEAPVYDRDVDRAREFLSAAGAEGLELTLTLPGETPGGRPAAEIIQANLKDAGIDLRIDVQDSAVLNELVPEVLEALELFYLWFITAPDPSWSTVWFTCDQVGVWNWMRWCNEEYQRLHAAALSELDPDRRHDMYIEMQRLWDEAVHTVWVAWPRFFFGAHPSIEPALRPDGRIIPWAARPK